MVNIIGLASGIAFTMIIGAYVWSELQVNKTLKHNENQYILQSKWKDPNQGIELTTMGPLARALKENYPTLVANYYRWDGVTSNVSRGDKSFREGLQICDSTLISMYGFSLLHGDVITAFESPYAVIITAEKAKKYFGKTDVVGQTLTIENFSGSKHDFVITAVLKNLSRNSVTFVNDANDNQFFISAANLAYFGRNMDWPNQFIVGYIELQPGVKPARLLRPMQELLKQNAPATVVTNMQPYLVSLKDYYLEANNGLIKKMLYALSVMALFILSMAVINFTNMSVSRSATRMREIGIRKVLGGFKKQLIIQFLIESVIIVSFATIAACIAYLLSADFFSGVLGKPLPSLTVFPLYFILLPILFTLVIGFIAGIYPAFILSSLHSVEALKGKLTSVKENILLRKSLVAFQFATAAIVFISAIIIAKQINLFFSDNLGFNKDYILSAQLPRNWTPEGTRKMNQFRNQFATMPQVSNATLSFEVPDGNSSGSVSVFKAGSDSTTAIASQLIMTDEYYAGTYNIPMAAGEFYSLPGAFTDSSKIVINETQSHALGFKNPHDAIGRQVYIQGGSMLFSITGVTKDFHFGSMQIAIQPVTFLHVDLTNTFRVLSFKLKPGDIGNTIAALQKKWSVLMPGTPFEYTFMDDTLAKIYTAEIQLKKAAYAATILAIIIVLLGVLGLISLSVQKRTKEIGIRKVLGSSVTSIMTLFMKEFMTVIILAAIIACPVAYLLMHQWLNSYVYRIDITPMPFIITIGFLGFITAILISIQTIKAAFANPIKSLRSE
ncbi:ABC transporter permease [soil metagenome]